MSDSKFNKRALSLTFIVVLLIGAFVILGPSDDKGGATPSEIASSDAVATPVTTEVASLSETDNIAQDEVVDEAHATDCAHCLAAEEPTTASEPFLSTNPSLDYIFKDFAKLQKQVTPRSTFDFLKGSHVGARGSFTLGGKVYSGTVTMLKEEHPVAHSYALALDDDLGRLVVTTNAHDKITAHVLFFDESRAFIASDYLVDASEPQLLVQATEVSDIFCAQKGTIYTVTGIRAPGADAIVMTSETESGSAPSGPIYTVALENNPNSEFVYYLDFDGEVVEGTPWLGGARIDAAPHVRADDNAFVTRVWRRVVEDFAPFDINVTTDRAVYDAAESDKRMMCVITPTTTAAPGAGGVAYLNSFRTDSPVVWTFNPTEYTCADTISHEGGHAFGLRHDGTTQNVEYYPGHTAGYTPGWSPIMGAGFSGGIDDAVTQWSRGEYTNANNSEDDVAIIGNTSNGFGFKNDDYANAFDDNNVGTMAITGPDQVGVDGLISRQADIDFFRFSTEQGDVSFSAVPIDVMSPDSQSGSETAGANLAATIKLYDATGLLIATGEPDGSEDLESVVEAYLEAGVYFVSVEGTGRGTDATVGFSDYASLGQYSIVGQLPVPPLAIFGGDKLDVAVVSLDTNIQTENDTDFGFTYVAAPAVQRTFLLTNIEPSDITNLSISLAVGGPFSIVSAPPALLPGEQSQYLTIAYNPTTTGVDLDTVLITYDTDDGPEVFQFAIGGTSTISATKDNYEENDTIGAAANLNAQEDVWLSDYKGVAFFMDDQFDAYTFTPTESGALLITIDIDYDATAGDITFELYNGTANSSSEPLVSSTAGNGTIRYILPSSYSGLLRKFYIVAKTTDLATVRNAYDLKWNASILEIGDDDFYEENDTQDQAFDLSGATATSLSGILGLGILDDEDWYRIDIPSDPFIRMFYVKALFTHAEGDINIQLYDGSTFSQFFPDTSATENDYEVLTYHRSVATADYTDNFTPTGNVSIMGVPPGTYYIRVYGDYAGNSYDLIFEGLRDDKYEVVGIDENDEDIENDDIDDAFDLGQTIVDKWLSEVDGIGTSSAYANNATAQNFVNSGDEDWYKFTIDNSVILEQVILEYESFDGGFMNVFLYDGNGNLLLSSTDFTFSNTLTLDVPTGFTYYIKVDAQSDISGLSGYDFKVTYSSEPPFVEEPFEDAYEDNDASNQVYDISGNEGFWLTAIDGYATMTDPDWYQIVVPVGATKLEVALGFDAGDGNINLTLATSAGVPLNESNLEISFEAAGDGNVRRVVWEDPIPGTYKIAATGDEVQPINHGKGNIYNLFWDITPAEDNYEENDNVGEPFDLSSYERQLLRKLDGLGVQADEDWYKVTTRSDTAQLRINATFTHADGDIDVDVYNTAGYLVARAISSTDNESIIYSNPVEGDYFIRLHYGDAGNEYDLSWSALNADEVFDLTVGDDEYEENDLRSESEVLSRFEPRLSNYLGLGTQKDDDWFEIDVPEDNLGLYVECLFTHVDGDIDFEIYDSLGYPIFTRDGIVDDEILLLDSTLTAGTYYIRVYGPNVGNDYDLYWVARIIDIYEENDTLETAYDTSLLATQKLSETDYATQGDDDWFAIPVTGNYPWLRVTLDYVDQNGAIDFTIIDTLANEYTANSTEDSETLFVPVQAGTNYVKVFGDDVYNIYDLTWLILQDDDYEENDTSDMAADIQLLPSISATQFDDDWFTFSSDATNSFLSVVARFDDDEGNIGIEVYYDDNGVITSLEVSDDVDEDIESVVLFATPGDYYVRVFGDGINENYTLDWLVAPDDEYEENDTLAEAADITGNEDEYLRAVQFDDDWYEVVVFPGEVSLRVDLRFAHEDGNLELTLYDALGEELAYANTDTDNEVIIYGPNPFGAEEGDTYYVKVSGSDAGTDYLLYWAATTEDIYEGDEGNNTYDRATDGIIGSEGFRISETSGYATSEDEDWYRVTINEGDDGVIIEVTFDQDDGRNIDIELFNASETLVARSNGFGDVERIHHTGGAGDYYLRVFNDLSGNPYDIMWNSYKEDILEIAAINPNRDNDGEGLPRDLVGDIRNFNLFGNDGFSLELALLSGMTQIDEDWYEVQVASGEDIFIVDLKFEHAQGDIDVAVYDVSGSLIFDSGGVDVDVYGEGGVFSPTSQIESTDDGERLTIRDLPPGNYKVCVYGYGILPPKDISGWMPGDFDPYAENLHEAPHNQFVDTTDPDESSYYTFSVPIARGMGNTYSMRWNSTIEDIYDVETPDTEDVEYNDDIYHRTFAGDDGDPLTVDILLVDQYGVADDDGIVDDNLRTFTFPGPNGELGDPDDLEVEYRPEYNTFGLVQFDDDWYEYTVDAGGGEPHALFVRIGFEHIQGDLGLRVYKASALDSQRLADGELTEADLELALIGESLNLIDNETVEYVSPIAETYYIQVIGEDLGTPYGLTVRAFLDDEWEENDTLAEADDNADITLLTSTNGALLFGIQRDTDYYRMDVPADQVHLFPSVLSINNGEDLGFTVTDENGAELPAGYFQTAVISPEPKTYYLLVTGDNSGSSYFFSWSFNNVDEYDVFMFPPDPENPEILVGQNDTPAGAADLTRQRLEPVYIPTPRPASTYINPITELGFDYALIGSLPLWVTNPIFDPFGHATQEGDDWYQLKIPSWELKQVQQEENNNTFQALKRNYFTRLLVDIEFDHADGDINLEVYDGYSIDPFAFDPDNLPTPIARSESSTLEDGTESVAAGIDPLVHDLIYYIRVYGDNNANDYSLKWEQVAEDAYEEDDTNNFVDLAYDLTNVDGVSTEQTWLHQIEYLVDVNGDGVVNAADGGFTAPRGYGSQTTDDWFTIVVSEDSTELEVHCDFFSDDNPDYRFTPDNLDMDIEVYFLAGNDNDPETRDLRKPVLVRRLANKTPEFTRYTVDKPEHVLADWTDLRHEFDTFAIDEPGIYFIRVFFDNRTHPYSLYWDDKNDVSNAGDQAIIDDYLNGDWSFAAPEDLPINLLENPYENTDGDRYPNWAEFALILDASKWDYVIIGKSIKDFEGQDYFHFEYLRSREAVALGYEFTVEEAEDLDFNGAEAILVETITINAQVERVIYRCTQPMSVWDKCFFRLQVEEPEPK
ncbi:MAG: hypothetical protein ACSHX4_00770 [Opitutaceae bacterium]